PRADRQRLVFTERTPEGAELGSVLLCYEDEVPVGSGSVALFAVAGYRNRCVSRAREAAYDLSRWWGARREGETFNHQMSRPHCHRFYVLYSCPRPVAIVSFEVNGKGNLFPMDLLGPIGPNHMLLALHDTSPSLLAMRSAPGLVLSEMPVEMTPEVYR